MRFASIGSGSKGNGTLVQVGDTCVLIDCGFTIKETEQRLARLDVSVERLSAILVTHEHSDHIGGVGPFARRHDVPVYITAGTHRSGKTGEVPQLHIIDSHDTFVLGELTIIPVPVPHDSREPVQYVLAANNKKLGVLTDLGSLTRHVTEQYRDCDALILECNHCPGMLQVGPYPPSVKERVAGDWGHLSNEQAAAFLDQVEGGLQHLVLAHLSEQNNSLEQVKAVMADRLKKAQNTLFACQQQGFDWLTIS